jgi:SAM-dependent methyltransferase
MLDSSQFSLEKSLNAKRRARIITDHSDLSTAEILEIGASDDPTFFKGEANIFFMDWFSREELFKKFKKTRPARANKLADVDYVIKDNKFSHHIQKKFDLIIANHVVEHIPDLISWLAQIRSILKPNGQLFLSIPHKEFTFDKIRRVSSAVDLLKCHDQKLSAPDVYQVFEHIHLWRPIKAENIWEDNYDHLLTQARFSIEESMKKAVQRTGSGAYVDVHCHVFTTGSWRGLIDDLKSLGKIPFQDIETIDVHEGCNEFYSLMAADT